jgi:hypothetical protein
LTFERREEDVSVLVIVEIPGGSSALDEALVKSWGVASSPPRGNRLRLSGPMDGGWRVISLWESREQFEEFLQARLHLTLEGAGTQEPSVTYWDVEKVHTFG